MIYFVAIQLQLIYNSIMVKSVNQVVYDPINGAMDYIYAYCTLRQEPNRFLITTYYQRIIDNEYRNFYVIEEPFSITEVDAIFEQLKSIIGNLPFSEMLSTGIELALLNDLNSKNKFGISANTNGWEIV